MQIVCIDADTPYYYTMLNTKVAQNTNNMKRY